MSPRRPSCRLPEGEACRSLGKRGLCGHCHDMSANARRASERMRKLNADPAFAAANARRASERMCKLNADPAFAAANAERMRKRHAARIAWCPEHLRDEYRFLRKRLGAAEARAIIERRIEQENAQ